MVFLKSLYVSYFIILVILSLLHCGNFSKITCPEDMWKQLGHAAGKIDFRNIKVMVGGALMAQNAMRFYMKEKNFDHKIKLDAVLSADRQVISKGMELYTMKIIIHQTRCMYNKRNGTIDKSQETNTNYIDNCDNDVPDHPYFNGTCCLQFIVQEYPIHNLTLQSVDCLHEHHETGEWKNMNDTLGFDSSEPWDNVANDSTIEYKTLRVDYDNTDSDGDCEFRKAMVDPDHRDHVHKDNPYTVNCKTEGSFDERTTEFHFPETL